MDQAQKTLDRQRNDMRQQKISRLREYADPSFDYQKKVTFIEGTIEKDFRYYDESNA